jgi:hypothetical protein
VLSLLLIDGAAREPELRIALHRAGGHRRHQRAMNAAAKIIASSNTTRSPVNPRPPPPVRVLKKIRNPSRRMIASWPFPARRLEDAPVELRDALHQVQERD